MEAASISIIGARGLGCGGGEAGLYYANVFPVSSANYFAKGEPNGANSFGNHSKPLSEGPPSLCTATVLLLPVK